MLTFINSQLFISESNGISLPLNLFIMNQFSEIKMTLISSVEELHHLLSFLQYR